MNPTFSFVCLVDPKANHNWYSQILTEVEADRRDEVYEKHRIFYMLDVENEDCAQYTLDATLYGNAARFAPCIHLLCALIGNYLFLVVSSIIRAPQIWLPTMFTSKPAVHQESSLSQRKLFKLFRHSLSVCPMFGL